MRSGDSRLQIDHEILKHPLSQETLASTDNVLINCDPSQNGPQENKLNCFPWIYTIMCKNSINRILSRDQLKYVFLIKKLDGG